MNKMAKPLYTDPEEMKAYEERKRLRRNILTVAGGVLGGYGGGLLGAGVGAASGFRRSHLLRGALAGAGAGALLGSFGSRKFVDFRDRYMESAGLDGTIPSLRAKLQKDAATKRAAPGAGPTLTEQIINRVDPKYQMRGAATYLRMVDPPNVATAAGLAGGAGLLGSAVLPGKGKSVAGRVARGVAGAGLVGGSLYLAKNEKARNAVREAVLGFLGKHGPSQKLADDHSFGNLASEVIGHTGGNAALLGVGGTLVGGPVGGVAGSAAGTIGTPLGGLLALLKKRRTVAEQRAHDASSHILKNLLVPGAGSYNMWKRIGSALRAHMEQPAAKAAEAPAVKTAAGPGLAHFLRRVGRFKRNAKIFAAGTATGGIGLGTLGYTAGRQNGFDELAPLVAKSPRDWSVDDVMAKNKALARIRELATKSNLAAK